MKITKCATSLSCAAVLALAPVLTTGCSKKPVIATESDEPVFVRDKHFVGLWESRDQKEGKVYSIRFTNNNQWECRVEEGGSSRNYYRGAYEYKGALELLIKEEGDDMGGWRPQRGNLEPRQTGKLSGNRLKIENFSKTDFTKKR